PQKMAARNVTALDVADAIRTQNIDAPAGRVGQPPIDPGQSFQLPLDTLGRLATPEQFGDIIVKVGGNPPVLSPSGVGVDAAPAAPRPRRRGGSTLAAINLAASSSAAGGVAGSVSSYSIPTGSAGTDAAPTDSSPTAGATNA